ncbi:hypothetical protein U27_01921 [Candidatus Vecturithrix granuli]|uniref:Uncharacterized protein n=1 Tax=Vecturithrix granuli TaxID=1499967 RepID=A0A0S6W9H4_VECG1|nr:hypothetical protein U27_01921 [Candidatus Vecturithrix granuli]
MKKLSSSLDKHTGRLQKFSVPVNNSVLECKSSPFAYQFFGKHSQAKVELSHSSQLSQNYLQQQFSCAFSLLLQDTSEMSGLTEQNSCQSKGMKL